MTQFYQNNPIQERTIYQDGLGVLVTNYRVVINGRTFPLGAITSTRAYKLQNNQLIPAIIMALGVIVFIGGLSQLSKNPTSGVWGIGLGLVVFTIGIIIHKFTKPMFSVRLGSYSGEIDAIISEDENYISAVVNAINFALVPR